MLRLLLYPGLRWTLLMALIVWPFLVARLYFVNDRGILPELSTFFVHGRSRATQWLGTEYLVFFESSSRSVDVHSLDSWGGELDDPSVIAISCFDRGWPRRYGLVYTPIKRNTVFARVQWIDRGDTTQYDESDLEGALLPYRSLCANPTPTQDELDRFENRGLIYSSILRSNLPLVIPSRSRWSLDLTHTVGEAAYLALFLWWLLTLRYARRVWPKADGSL